MQYAAASLFEIELRSANQRRHWSPASQPYAPADVLLEYLADGWKLSSVVGRAEHWCGAGRHIDVYYFELTRDNRTMVMPVHGNPTTHRLVWERQLRIVSLSGDDRLMEDKAPEMHPLQRTEVEHWAATIQRSSDRQHAGEQRRTARLLSGRQRHLPGVMVWLSTGRPAHLKELSAARPTLVDFRGGPADRLEKQRAEAHKSRN